MRKERRWHAREVKGSSRHAGDNGGGQAKRCGDGAAAGALADRVGMRSQKPIVLMTHGQKWSMLRTTRRVTEQKCERSGRYFRERVQ